MTTLPSLDQIADRLVPFGATLSVPQIEGLRQYLSMLLQWNQKISLTALTDPLEIVSRHLGESLFFGSLFEGTVSGRLADLGTGAGLPGIPLKIAFPTLELTLIEPNQKKCAFLKEVAQALGLHDIVVFRGPYADFPDRSKPFDFICSRALGKYKDILRWATYFLSEKGTVALWLGEEDAHLVSTVSGWHWKMPARLPESKRRLILAGIPTTHA